MKNQVKRIIYRRLFVHYCLALQWRAFLSKFKFFYGRIIIFSETGKDLHSSHHCEINNSHKINYRSCKLSGITMPCLPEKNSATSTRMLHKKNDFIWLREQWLLPIEFEDNPNHKPWWKRSTVRLRVREQISLTFETCKEIIFCLSRLYLIKCRRWVGNVTFCKIFSVICHSAGDETDLNPHLNPFFSQSRNLPQTNRGIFFIRMN